MDKAPSQIYPKTTNVLSKETVSTTKYQLSEKK